MVNRIVTVDLSGSNKGFNSKHCVDSQVRREAPEEGRKTYRPKLCDYNHKYKVNSSNILSNNNYRASLGGARGVMVIVVGIVTRRHEFKSWTDCISHSTNTLGKGMNPIILPPAMGK